MVDIATESARPITAEVVGEAVFTRPRNTQTIRTLDQIIQTGAPLDFLGGRKLMEPPLRKTVVDSIFGGKEPRNVLPMTPEERQVRDVYDRIAANLTRLADASATVDIVATIPPHGSGAEMLVDTLQQTILNTPGLREMYLRAIGGEHNLGNMPARRELQKLIGRGLLQDITRGKLNEVLILQPDYVGFGDLQERLLALETKKTAADAAVTAFKAANAARIAAGSAPRDVFVDNRKFRQDRIDSSSTHIAELRKTGKTIEDQVKNKEAELLKVKAAPPASQDVIDHMNDDLDKLKMKLDDVNVEINTEVNNERTLRTELATQEAEYNVAVQYEKLQQDANAATEALSKGNIDLQNARGRILKQALELDGKLQNILPDASTEFFKKLETQLDSAYKRSQEDEAKKKIEDAKKEGDMIGAAEGLMIDALTRRYQKPVGKGRRQRYEIDKDKLRGDFARMTKSGSIAFTKDLIGSGFVGKAFGVGSALVDKATAYAQDEIKRAVISGATDQNTGDLLGTVAGLPKQVVDMLKQQFGDKMGSAVLPLQVEMYFKQHPEAQQKLVDKVKGRVFNEVAQNAVTHLNLDDKTIRVLASSDDFIASARSAADRIPMVNDLIGDLKNEGIITAEWKKKMEGTLPFGILGTMIYIMTLGQKNIFKNN